MTHCVAATGRGAYMGWAVLYIAFGVVALWLLGEVLLQYKARLRWRLLAFGGFLGVVLGVLIPNVRSEEHTSELQSLMRISYAVFCLKKKTETTSMHYIYA